MLFRFFDLISHLYISLKCHIHLDFFFFVIDHQVVNETIVQFTFGLECKFLIFVKHLNNQFK